MPKDATKQDAAPTGTARRHAPRFAPMGPYIITFYGRQVLLIDICETGLRVECPPGIRLVPGENYEFDVALPIRDKRMPYGGWHLTGCCTWTEGRQSGIALQLSPQLHRAFGECLNRTVSSGYFHRVSSIER